MGEVKVQAPLSDVANSKLTAEYVLPDLRNIIVPPPDLRPIVEKTAAYVAKHGTPFEAVILSKQQNDRRFDFLHPDNAYHSFYKSKLVQLLLPPEEQERLRQLQDEQEAECAALAQLEAQHEAEDAEIESPPPKPVVLSFRERLKLDIARSCQAHLIPTCAAELDSSYACVLPASYGVNALDRDILRLTARYVASQGKSFLNGLLIREARNPSFDFLRSSHPYFQFFQGTVQAYERIMNGRLQQVEKELDDPHMVRELILGRIEYERIQEKLIGQKERDDEKERIEMAMIDWYDFVVLRTVDFHDEEQLFLPAPFNTIDEINRALDAQEQLQADRDVEMEVDTDMAIEPEAPPEVVPESQFKDMAQAERNRAQTSTQHFQKCPSCGELVRQNELSEHVRICLLDPRWKVQKQASLQKQRESNLISGSDIGRHLSELARRRQDIFSTPSGSGVSAEPSEPLSTNAADSVSVPSWHEPESALQPPSVPHHGSSMAPPVFPGGGSGPAIPSYQHMLPNQSMQGFPHPVQYAQYPPTMPAPVPPQMPPPPQHAPPIPYLGPAPTSGFPHAAYPGAHTPAGIPQPPPAAPPAPHHHFQPPPPPPPKRTRTTETAAQWAARYPNPVDFVIQLPNQESDSNLHGQQITLSLSIDSTALRIKEALIPLLNNLPAKKMKLQVSTDGHWLKDAETLAELNLQPGTRLIFELKERGRKK